jgi:hypothetical protein
MTKWLLPLLLLTSMVTLVGAEDAPLALLAEVEALGRGTDGTVMGIVVQVAPEDRDRAGDRIRIVVTLLSGDDIVDRQAAVVPLEDDGSTSCIVTGRSAATISGSASAPLTAGTPGSGSETSRSRRWRHRSARQRAPDRTQSPWN